MTKSVRCITDRWWKLWGNVLPAAAAADAAEWEDAIDWTGLWDCSQADRDVSLCCQPLYLARPISSSTAHKDQIHGVK